MTSRAVRLNSSLQPIGMRNALQHQSALPACGRSPVPTVGVHDGGSLAGNESADASWTRSSGATDAFQRCSSNHRRAVGQSPSPVSAHQASVPPRPASSAAVSPLPRALDRERAAADAEQPAGHGQSFARAVPAATVPDAGGARDELSGSVRASFVHVMSVCMQVQVHRSRDRRSEWIPYTCRHAIQQRMALGADASARRMRGRNRPGFRLISRRLELLRRTSKCRVAYPVAPSEPRITQANVGGTE